MICVSLNPGQIKITGHANYGEYGNDIVCAAVSVLVQNLIQSIEELTEDTIYYDMAAGFATIKYKKLSRRGKVLFDSFFLGIRSVADAYPENIRVN